MRTDYSCFIPLWPNKSHSIGRLRTQKREQDQAMRKTMKVHDLSINTRYSTIKDAYEAAVKDGKSCVLKAVPKGGGKPEYVIFPFKEWRKFDTYTFKDDGYKYGI